MRREKGITLVTLVVAVTILTIISSMLIYNAKNGIKMRNLKMMQNDIEMLDDKINAYYIKYGTLPIQILYIGGFNFEPQANDGSEYYVIDLSALEGLTLNYGLDYENIETEADTKDYTDIYIINKQSRHIYYVHGIEMDGVMYYANDDDDEIILNYGNYLTGGKFYETLQEAIDSAQSGDTIKVTNNVTETYDQDIEIDKNINLNTNGKILNLNIYGCIIILDGSEMNISGTGTIDINELSTTSSGIVNHGILKISDVTITSNISKGLLSTINNKGTTFINSGIISNKNDSSYSLLNSSGTITINGGEITTTIHIPVGKLQVNGGKIKYIEALDYDNVEINGGEIEKDIYYYG